MMPTQTHRSRLMPMLLALALLLAFTAGLRGDDDPNAGAQAGPNGPNGPNGPVPGPVVQDPAPAEPGNPQGGEGDGPAQPPPDDRPVSETSSELANKAQDAVDKGLAWLKKEQKPNGSWVNDVGYKLNYSYEVTRRNGDHPGVTAICCLAYMAAGNMPGRGEYGETVRKGLKFVLSCIADRGGVPGFCTNDGTRMYSHAFATLFLAEVLGMANLSSEDEDEVRKKLRLAVDMIVQSQNAQGSWRYAPNAQDADMSICVCQMQALRAARNVGMRVPPTTIERARAYIARSYQNYGRSGSNSGEGNARPYLTQPNHFRDGTFLYQNDQDDGSRFSWTLCAAGVCALQQAGNYDSFLDAAGDRIYLHPSIYYLRSQLPYSADAIRRSAGRLNLPFSYFYGHYYASQAIYQYSRKYPEVWPQWLTDIRTKFVALQRPDGDYGYWEDQIGRHYATGMSCLILQIHQEFLPIFQK